MLRLLTPLCFIFLVFACGKKEAVQTNEILLSEKPAIPTKLDSVEVGKPIPLGQPDTFSVSTSAQKKVVYDKTPLQRNNIFRDVRHRTLTKSGPDTLIKAAPEVVKAEPYISYVIHPAPVKAGEMRTSKSASENIQYLDVEQGLASSRINCIEEDHFGFLWFGMHNGLTRYDGNYFYHYDTHHGLVHNYVHDLFIDSKNNFWIGTEGGLVRFDGTRFETYTAQNGLLKNPVSSLMEDADGNIWFLSENAGVSKFDGTTFYHFTKENGLHSDMVVSIGIDSLDRIFLGYFGQLTCDYITDDTIFRHHNIWIENGSDLTNATFRDKDGYLWLANYNGGASRLSPTQPAIQIFPPTGIPYQSLNIVYQDSRDDFWFGSIEAGITRLGKDSVFHAYTTAEGLSSNLITDLLEDSQGNIWLGTLGGGVNKITPGSFKTMTDADGLSDKTVINIHQNPRGEILFGTWADGIWTFNGTEFKKLYPDVERTIIYSFTEDYFGNTIATSHQHGTFVLTPSETDSIPYDSICNYKTRENNFRAWGIRKIEMDADGNLWMCDDLYGLYHYKLSADKTHYASYDHYTIEDGLLSNVILSMEMTNDGALWIANKGLGMSRIKDGMITHYTEKTGLSSNTVNFVYHDKKDRLWLGTSKGITIYDGNEFSYISKTDNLSSDAVGGIAEDQDGRFWVGTTRGLNLLEPDENMPCGYVITNFHAQDGLQSTEFLTGGILCDNQNTLWLATRSGLIHLNIAEFDQELAVPTAEISQLSLFDQHIAFSSLYDSIQKKAPFSLPDSSLDLTSIQFSGVSPFFNRPENLILPYNINTITFYFSALGGLASHQIHYQYRLLGYDEKWSTESDITEAKYANLPAGDYTFEVQPRVTSKKWGKIVAYSFTITPPYWETWWFRLLMILGLIGLIYGIVRWRNRALLIRQQQLENTVRERTQEIQEQKTLIEEKQTEILDSINYAQRIQRALLATDELLHKNLNDYFVFFQPKDIVSGDFYWASSVRTSDADSDSFILVTADSTGHGVPGAIMSMLNISSLEKAIESEKAIEPAAILNFTRRKIIDTLAKDGSAQGGKDGMDCSLIRFDFEKNQLVYAAANNGIWLIRNNELLEFAPDKMPVGKHDRDTVPFTQHIIPLQQGDLIYTFTDGMADQFGGEKGKKFKYKTLKTVLLNIAHMPMDMQRLKLEETFTQWKGDLEQVDDICILGVRVK